MAPPCETCHVMNFVGRYAQFPPPISAMVAIRQRCGQLSRLKHIRPSALTLRGCVWYQSIGPLDQPKDISQQGR